MNDDFRPKLRGVEAQWVEHEGQPALLLQDRLAIGARAVVVPQILAPLLAFCDGSHTLSEMRVALELRTGIRLEAAVVEKAIAHLDQALMLENEHFAMAFQEALEEYRSSPYRPAALAGSSYPARAEELHALLDVYLSDAALNRNGHALPPGRLRGIVCPHIDYQRGGAVYGQLWSLVAQALPEADEFIILGTDHAGGPAEITLTRHDFQTPYGVLETDREGVDAVAAAMGEDYAFASEMNHRSEHSVELAAVWLHHMVGDRPVKILPVLCGSFHYFTQGESHPSLDPQWQAGADALREIASRPRTMVIAAADLAHMGPAFGDEQKIGVSEKASLASADARMLGAVCRGDAEGFLEMLVEERDSRKVCGLPPIYLMLRMLGDVSGEVVDYLHCPAGDGSVVSITGVLLSERVAEA